MKNVTKNKIALTASIGISLQSSTQVKLTKESLLRIDYCSVREVSTYQNIDSK